MINLDKKVERILDIVVKYQDFLTQPENLPQLAKIMITWRKAYSCVWIAHGDPGMLGKKRSWCRDNPKYYILEYKDFKNSEIQDLVYDAWCVESTNDGPWDHPFYWQTAELTSDERFMGKPHKTMRDWHIYLNRYFDDRRMSRRSLEYRMLCAFGTGTGWDADGYMDHLSPSGYPFNFYGDWRNAEINEEVRKDLDRVFKTPDLKKAIAAAEKYIEEYLKTYVPNQSLIDMEKKFNALMLKHEPDYLDPDKVAAREKSMRRSTNRAMKEQERKDGFYNQICEYSPIMHIPKNAHKSYLDATKRICDDILGSEYEKPKTKKQAKKILKDLKKRKLIEV